jgi:type IV pilus assembly protein PilO
MNLMEEIRSLDPSDPGRWPLPFRAGAVAVWFLVLTLALSYAFVWQNQRPELQRREAEEQDLREQFRTKHAKAINLEAYKQQLADIERSFGALLRQLPGKTEVPNLLVDISQTGLAAGLEEKLFQPQSESRKDFYAELPISIRLTGGYHEMGKFASGIAALPRIVTLHDIEITPSGRGAGANSDPSTLTLNVTAKTYRYLDEDEQGQEQPSGKAKKGPKDKPAKG